MESARFGAALTAALLAAGAMAAGHAAAQPYPARPIRLIIPFSPGGATDTPARLIAQKLPDAIGQPVIVDNRPGAGSAIGTEIVAKAQPDGYTLLLTGTPFAAISTLYGKLPFDPARDFVSVMQVASAPNVLAVHPSLPVRSVKNLIAMAQLQPGKPASAMVGMSGNLGERLLPVTPSGRSLPVVKWPEVSRTLENAIPTSPAIAATTAGAPPLKCTAIKLTLPRWLNSSPATWGFEPTPAVP